MFRSVFGRISDAISSVRERISDAVDSVRERFTGSRDSAADDDTNISKTDRDADESIVHDRYISPADTDRDIYTDKNTVSDTSLPDIDVTPDDDIEQDVDDIFDSFWQGLPTDVDYADDEKRHIDVEYSISIDGISTIDGSISVYTVPDAAIIGYIITERNPTIDLDRIDMIYISFDGYDYEIDIDDIYDILDMYLEV